MGAAGPARAARRLVAPTGRHRGGRPAARPAGGLTRTGSGRQRLSGAPRPRLAASDRRPVGPSREWRRGESNPNPRLAGSTEGWFGTVGCDWRPYLTSAFADGRSRLSLVDFDDSADHLRTGATAAVASDTALTTAPAPTPAGASPTAPAAGRALRVPAGWACGPPFPRHCGVGGGRVMGGGVDPRLTAQSCLTRSGLTSSIRWWRWRVLRPRSVELVDALGLGQHGAPLVVLRWGVAANGGGSLCSVRCGRSRGPTWRPRRGFGRRAFA